MWIMKFSGLIARDVFNNCFLRKLLKASLEYIIFLDSFKNILFYLEGMWKTKINNLRFYSWNAIVSPFWFWLTTLELAKKKKKKGQICPIYINHLGWSNVGDNLEYITWYNLDTYNLSKQILETGSHWRFNSSSLRKEVKFYAYGNRAFTGLATSGKKKKLKKKKKDKNRKQNPRNSHLSVLIGFIYFKLPYLV